MELRAAQTYVQN